METANTFIKRLTEMAIPVCEQMGVSLWGIETDSDSKASIVRIYIEADGLNIDKCAEVSRHLSLLLDVEDVVDGKYRLEVSSPGLERPLFTFDQMRQYVGRTVSVKLTEPLIDRKNFKGILESAEDDVAVVSVDGESYELPFSLVKKAHLVVTDWKAVSKKQSK